MAAPGSAGYGLAIKGYVEIHDLLFLILIYKYYILSWRGEVLQGGARFGRAWLVNKVM